MEPAQLFDEAVGQRWIFLQLGQLIWVFEELDDAQVDHVDHRRVPGNEEEEGDLHGIVLGDVTGFDLETLAAD